ncbi:molybdopterin-dependent oxidoreductase [Breoghania sp. JC706]|uniref:molybdopterin-dependent oxidoreductase n=1 Tax=Breoghania sp. JC706 TaxID=3117732 RepID=UPI00300BE720
MPVETMMEIDMKTLLATLLALIAIAPLAVADVRAGPLPEPTGKTLLVVRGNIERTNRGDAAHFDLAMLEALPGRTARVETPWTNGTVAFEGPLLRAVLDHVGAQGEKLVIRALNDYSAEVPLSDARDFDTILALKKDGKHMSVREKGPIFLIYPFDKNPELYNEKYFVRSVWQIKEIEVMR